jgi:NAD(P)-dependent dehydrogenase (short-subunit alcohol dehydrogenase family)
MCFFTRTFGEENTMTDLLANKVAVITGAASGIGRGIALAFARHGAKAVIVADIREEPREGGKPTHEVIQAETQTRATFATCNVMNIADLEATVEAAEAFGGIEIMVNNAGIVLSARGCAGYLERCTES